MNGSCNRVLLFYWMMFNPVNLFQRINELDWYQETLHAWVDDLHAKANAEVLELGCATGMLTEYLASCGFTTTGIDASDKMIKAALANTSRRANYQTADAKALPFTDSRFDVVVSASLLNIFNEQEKLLKEMVQVCKPGGLVSALTPKQGISDDQITDLINAKCSNDFSKAVLSTWHKRAPKLHPEAIEDCFKQAGLQTVQKRDYLGGMVTTVTAVRASL